MSPHASAAVGIGALVAMAVAPIRHAVDTGAGAPLRVCAAPNDLPFSDDRRQGFENHLAELIARELGRPLEYVWAVGGRGFAREMLHAGECDVVMGVVAEASGYSLSQPYYHSAFALVSLRSRGLDLYALDDARIRSLTVALHVSEDAGASVPRASVTIMRDLLGHSHRLLAVGDQAGRDRTARVMDAVADGEVDAAVVWGPLAAHHAQHSRQAFAITPITSRPDGGGAPPLFGVSVGVRRSAPNLLTEIDRALVRRASEVDRILGEFKIPVLVPDDRTARLQPRASPPAAAGDSGRDG